MSSGGGAIAVVGIIGAAALLLMHSGTANAGQVPGGGGVRPNPSPVPMPPPQPIPTDKWGDTPGLPPSLAASVDAEIRNDTNPANLRELADSLEPNFHYAANALRAAAAALEQRPSPLPPTPPPAPVPVPLPVVPPPPTPPAPSPTPPAPPPDPGDVPFGMNPTPWDPSWPIPVARGDAPSVYAEQGHSSDFTGGVRDALNNWGSRVGFPTSAIFPATTGYGPNMAHLVAAFQAWLNRSGARDYPAAGNFGGVTVDGILGGESAPFLNPWHPDGFISE